MSAQYIDDHWSTIIMKIFTLHYFRFYDIINEMRNYIAQKSIQRKSDICTYILKKR